MAKTVFYSIRGIVLGFTMFSKIKFKEQDDQEIQISFLFIVKWIYVSSSHEAWVVQVTDPLLYHQAKSTYLLFTTLQCN